MLPPPPAEKRPFGVPDLIAVATMNLFWGLNVVAVKVSVDAVSPTTAAFLRQLIVLLVCATALRIVPGKMRALTALGILSGGAFYLALNLGLAIATNVGALAIAGQLGVPFALLLSVMVFKERIHLPRMAGIALSLLGVGILVFDPGIADEVLGIGLTALGSLFWAIASLIQRTLVGVRILTIYAWIGFWGSITLGLAAWAFEPTAFAAIPEIPLHTMSWIAFSAIGSTVMAHGAMSWLLQRHPVSVVMPLTLAAPVISVFTAAWYFNTSVTAIMLIGGALAMLGVAIVTIRTARAPAP